MSSIRHTCGNPALRPFRTHNEHVFERSCDPRALRLRYGLFIATSTCAIETCIRSALALLTSGQALLAELADRGSPPHSSFPSLIPWPPAWRARCCSTWPPKSSMPSCAPDSSWGTSCRATARCRWAFHIWRSWCNPAPTVSLGHGGGVLRVFCYGGGALLVACCGTCGLCMAALVLCLCVLLLRSSAQRMI